jgi:hypothetical protein
MKRSKGSTARQNSRELAELFYEALYRLVLAAVSNTTAGLMSPRKYAVFLTTSSLFDHFSCEAIC